MAKRTSLAPRSAASAAVFAMCVFLVVCENTTHSSPSSASIAEAVTAVSQEVLLCNATSTEDFLCCSEIDQVATNGTLISSCSCDINYCVLETCYHDLKNNSSFHISGGYCEDISESDSLKVCFTFRCQMNRPAGKEAEAGNNEIEAISVKDYVVTHRPRGPQSEVSHQNESCVLFVREEGRGVVAALGDNDARGHVVQTEGEKQQLYHCKAITAIPQKMRGAVEACLDETDSEIPKLQWSCATIANNNGNSSGAQEEEAYICKRSCCAFCGKIGTESVSVEENETENKEETNSYFHKMKLSSGVDASELNNVLLDSAAQAKDNRTLNDATKRKHQVPCVKYLLFADEFELHDDGTVYAISQDRHYSPDEYEHIGENVAVCSKIAGFGKIGDTISIIALVFVSASMLCLCLHLAAFCLVPKLRNLPGKNLASFCVALLLSYTCLLAGPFPEVGSSSCRALAIIIYIAFIASLLWTNVMAFDVFTTLRRSATELRVSSGGRPRRFLLYCLYVLLTTGALVVSAVSVDLLRDPSDPYRPGFGDRVCWFSRPKAMMMFFAAPLVALMVVNVALFCGSAIIIRRTSQATVNTASSKTNLRLYTRLALITGMSWVIGLLAGWLHFPPLWYIFIVLDTLQGVFIFVSFTLTQRVRRDVERELSRYSAKRRCSRQSLRSSREKNTVKGGVEGERCERALRGYVNTAVSESLPGCEGSSGIVRVSVVDPVFAVKEEMQEENLENGKNGM